MKKIICIILVSFAITNFCFAETNENEIPPPTIISVEDNNEELEELENVILESNNMETVVYIHPITLTTLITVAKTSPTLCLYVTIEKPLSLSNSLIIKPSLFVNYEWGFHDFSTDKMDRFGSDIGIRYYPSGKGEGWYWQPQGGVFYLKGEYDAKGKIVGDGMIYFGYSGKSINFSLFIDIGLGIGNTTREGGWGSDVILDCNWGIGMKF